MTFEIFCIDQKGKVKFKDTTRFLDALAFNAELWTGQPQKNTETAILFDNEQGITIKIDIIDTSKVVADNFVSAFVIKATGELPALEPIRLKLVTHIRDLDFNHIRILSDDVSTQLSVEIYPLINKIENLLRRYIVKFFITKIGLGWFDISVAKEVKDKISIRKDNEPVFTKNNLVNTDVTLIDFNELGEIITRQTSVFSKVEDVISKIQIATDLETLKGEVSGHYPKYFKEIFEKQNFDSKWRALFNIRNKVAHNNYLVIKDLSDAKLLCEELEKIFIEAEAKIDEAVFTVTEKQAIGKAIADTLTKPISEPEQDDLSHLEELPKIEEQTEALTIKRILLPGLKILPRLPKTISEDTFLEELEKFSNNKKDWTFIALSKFFDYLDELGYNRDFSSTIASILNDKEMIEIEYIDNPFGLNKTATIKKKN